MVNKSVVSDVARFASIEWERSVFPIGSLGTIFPAADEGDIFCDDRVINRHWGKVGVQEFLVQWHELILTIDKIMSTYP